MDTHLEGLFWIAILAPLLLVPLMIYVRKKKPDWLRPIEWFMAGAVTALVARELIRLL